MKLDEWFTKTAPCDILKELHKRYTDQMYFVCPIDIYTNDCYHMSCPKHEDCNKCIEDFMHKEIS